MLYIFFFLMLLMPTIFQAPRGILLLFLLFGIKRIGVKYVYPKIYELWLLNTIFLLFSLLYGLIVGNQGAISAWTVDLLWPFLYLIFMMNCRSIEMILKLFKVIIVGGLVINIMNIILLLNEIYLDVGILSSFATTMGGKYGIYNGFTEFFVPSADFAPYFLYFGFALILLPHRFLGVNTFYISSLVVSSLIIILFSGRRASWLLVVMMPIIVLSFFKLCKIGEGMIGKIIKIIAPVAIVLYGGLYYILDVEILLNNFLSTFDMYEDVSNYERTLQAQSLWNDFVDNPIFGKGTGYVSSYIRTPDKPWQYELSYNYMLSSKGIIGISIILFSYFAIIIGGIKFVRKHEDWAGLVIPPVCGIICLSIMNGTNPYINKFDFLWIFFLPIIILNFLYFNPNLKLLNSE